MDVVRPIEVLLVEDCPADVLLVREVVADCAVSVQLRVAWDGQQALEVVSHAFTKPDLIILDIDIPKVSGLEFLRRFGRTNVPIVIFNSTSNPNKIRQGLALGAREFVQKPTDLQSFRAAVQDILDKWTAEGCKAP